MKSKKKPLLRKFKHALGFNFIKIVRIDRPFFTLRKHYNCVLPAMMVEINGTIHSVHAMKKYILVILAYIYIVIRIDPLFFVGKTHNEVTRAVKNSRENFIFGSSFKVHRFAALVNSKASLWLLIHVFMSIMYFFFFAEETYRAGPTKCPSCRVRFT